MWRNGRLGFSVGRVLGDQNRWRNVAGKISGISPLKKECSVWVGFIEMTPVHIQFEKHLSIFFSKTSVFFVAWPQKTCNDTAASHAFQGGILPETKLYHDPVKWTCYNTIFKKNKRWRQHFFGQFFFMVYFVVAIFHFFGPWWKETNGRYDSTFAKLNAAGPSKEAESPSQMDLQTS